MRLCVNCRQEISETAKFCRFCGKKKEEIYCRKCGAFIEPDSLFCSECGLPVGSGELPEKHVSGLCWEEDSGENIFVTGHRGIGADVNIPPVINGKRVTEICPGAFFGNRFVKNIVLPDSVTRIGERAFWKCSSLENVTLPKGITEIGTEMFCECDSLKNVNIPEGVVSIGRSAFEHCISLNSISIPESVRYIESSAFLGCASLKSIIMPDSIVSIGSGVFTGCVSLTINYKGKTYKPGSWYMFQDLYNDINHI